VTHPRYNAGMRLSVHDAQLRIYDDVLSPQDFAAVWSFMQLERYRSVHSKGWEKVWRISDGAPLWGALVQSALSPGEDDPDDPARLYPTGSGIDRVLRSVLELAPEAADLIGSSPEDWWAVSGRPYLYPAGSGLSWHVDEGRYAGAFTYYCHPRWNSQWGGELMVADPSCKGRDLHAGRIAVWDGRDAASVKTVEIPPFLDNSRESAVLEEIGVGRFVHPKPNRLVLIAPAHPHRINPVSPAAGDAVRATIAGFFLSSVERKGSPA
jgi:hypothetical protein